MKENLVRIFNVRSFYDSFRISFFFFFLESTAFVAEIFSVNLEFMQLSHHCKRTADNSFFQFKTFRENSLFVDDCQKNNLGQFNKKEHKTDKCPLFLKGRGDFRPYFSNS